MGLWELFKSKSDKELTEKAKTLIPRLIDTIHSNTILTLAIKATHRETFYQAEDAKDKTRVVDKSKEQSTTARDLMTKLRIDTELKAVEDRKHLLNKLLEETKEPALKQLLTGLNSIADEAEFELNILKAADDLEIRDVFCEIACFYLHFVDRYAYKVLGEKKRNVFIDTLFAEFPKALLRIFGKENAKWIDRVFTTLLDSRITQYSNYKKLIAEQNESEKDTLLWEFGKIVAEEVGMPKNPIFILQLTTIILESLEPLKLRDLLKGLAKET
jgi:hypothetical protein